MDGVEDNTSRTSEQTLGDSSPTVGQMVESIVGCKWSLAVLAALRAGVVRPGEVERRCAGISSKVLYERLRKLERFGLVQRHVHEVVPPHVEYHFTPHGERFLTILDAIDEVQRGFDAAGAGN